MIKMELKEKSTTEKPPPPKKYQENETINVLNNPKTAFEECTLVGDTHSESKDSNIDKYLIHLCLHNPRLKSETESFILATEDQSLLR